MEKVCKNKSKATGTTYVVAEDQVQIEEKLFVATLCTAKEAWVIDIASTNHMTRDVSIFKELDKTYTSKVKIGNSDCRCQKENALLQ